MFETPARSPFAAVSTTPINYTSASGGRGGLSHFENVVAVVANEEANKQGFHFTCLIFSCANRILFY